MQLAPSRVGQAAEKGRKQGRIGCQLIDWETHTKTQQQQNSV